MKPIKMKLPVLLAALLILSLASACLGLTAPGDDPSAAYTAGASTLIARLTLESGQTAVARLTQMASFTPPEPPRITPPPKPETSFTPQATGTNVPRPPAQEEEPGASATPSPTLAASPTFPAAPTFTLSPLPCNRMEFLGDVTAPLDSVFPAGSVFTKSWRVRNLGSCTWDSRYALVFMGGSLGVSQVAVSLPAVVPPGQIVDLAVTVTAPSGPGVYQATWMMRSSSLEFFGYGADASAPLIARIQVFTPNVDRGTTYDLAANMCALTWSSAAGSLPCPGNEGSRQGFVLQVQSPNLETGRPSGYGLLTHPNQDSEGWIRGITPLIPIRSGDHFVTEIGCVAGSSDCDVNFELEYQTVNGATGRLGRWRETYDGLTNYVDVDLSTFAGRSLYLILTVTNRGRARDADAFWLLPRIQPASAPRDNILTWTRQGQGDPDACDELHIFTTGINSAMAIAYDCSFGSFELGRTSLTEAQVTQLNRWREILENFEGEVYAAAGGNPVSSWVNFRGYGSGVAGETEIRALENFAAQIFSQITR